MNKKLSAVPAQEPKKKVSIQVKHINHPVFLGALGKLDQGQYANPETTLQVMRLVRQCHKLVKQQRDLYQRITKKYALLDEKGEVTIEAGNIKFKDEASEKAHSVEFEKMMEVNLEMNSSPLELYEIAGAKLTPMEMQAILPLLNVDDEDDGIPETVQE